MPTKAYVSITVIQQIELDVDDLVESFGPKARTKAFLTDYALGNRDGGGVAFIDEVLIERTPDPKVRRIVVR